MSQQLAASDYRNYAYFPVRLSDHQRVTILLVVAAAGTFLLSYYYDSLEATYSTNKNHNEHPQSQTQGHQHHSHRHEDLWTQLRSQGFVETIKVNRTFGLSVLIAGLFLVYGVIFRLIVNQERVERRTKKISYQDTDFSMAEESQSPSPMPSKSEISPSPSPVRPRTILKKQNQEIPQYISREPRQYDLRH